MLVNIKAKFSCDDCGTEFIVGVEPSYNPPSGWSIFDVAEDAIRGGLDYEDARDDTPALAFGTVDGDGRHYCDMCSGKRGQEENEEE